MPVYRLPDEVAFPPPEQAEEGGLIAIGGDLRPERLIRAYETGIFPWYSEGQPILWFSPDPRMVVMPGKFKCSKSLERTLNSKRFTVRADTRFSDVIDHCSRIPRPRQEGTWITEDMIQAYSDLHRLGFAHSFETYFDGELVGGLYGVSLGAAFFGESMFHLQRDASKVAFAKLVEFCEQREFHFIDAQVPTEHLNRLGAENLPRSSFLKLLAKSQKYRTLKGPWTDLLGRTP